MQTKRTFALAVLTAAALGALSVTASATHAPKIAVDLTTLTSPFWTAYNKYLVSEAKALGVDLLGRSTPSSTQRNRSPGSRTRSRWAPTALFSRHSTAPPRGRF
jgi:ABC-type sugar transport system substrate-binding protein